AQLHAESRGAERERAEALVEEIEEDLLAARRRGTRVLRGEDGFARPRGAGDEQARATRQSAAQQGIELARAARQWSTRTIFRGLPHGDARVHGEATGADAEVVIPPLVAAS